MKVGETKKQRKHNMKEDEWRGTKKEDGEYNTSTLKKKEKRKEKKI